MHLLLGLLLDTVGVGRRSTSSGPPSPSSSLFSHAKPINNSPDDDFNADADVQNQHHEQDHPSVAPTIDADMLLNVDSELPLPFGVAFQWVCLLTGVVFGTMCVIVTTWMYQTHGLDVVATTILQQVSSFSSASVGSSGGTTSGIDNTVVDGNYNTHFTVGIAILAFLVIAILSGPTILPPISLINGCQQLSHRMFWLGVVSCAGYVLDGSRNVGLPNSSTVISAVHVLWIVSGIWHLHRSNVDHQHYMYHLRSYVTRLRQNESEKSCTTSGEQDQQRRHQEELQLQLELDEVMYDSTSVFALHFLRVGTGIGMIVSCCKYLQSWNVAVGVVSFILFLKFWFNMIRDDDDDHDHDDDNHDHHDDKHDKARNKTEKTDRPMKRSNM